MSADASWKVSGTYLSALVEAMEARKILPQVKAALPDEIAGLLASAGTQRWWPGTHLVALVEAAAKATSPEELRKTAIFASHDRMGPLAKPLFSIILILSKTPIDSLCSRVESFVALSLKGVHAGWQRTSEGKGTLTFDFPEPVPAAMAELWHGMTAVAFELARAGRVERVTVEPAQHRFELAW